MSVTLKEMAKILGVSCATVSRALHDKPDIGFEMKQKVRDLAKTLNYRPCGIARSLVLQRSFTLGFLMPEMFSHYYAEIAAYVEAYAQKKGYSIILAASANKISERSRDLVDRGVDGLILLRVDWTKDLDYLLKLKEEKVPFVINGEVMNVEADSVTVNRIDGARTAVKYLVDIGHEKIGYVCAHLTDGRLIGFEKSLLEAHIKQNPDWIIYEDSSLSGGYESMKCILRLSDRPTAIFAHNDVAAIGAMRAIREANLRVPQDISIIGFDNINDAEYLAPPLTTVDQPKKEIARILVDTILNRLKNPDYEYQQTILDAKLIVRESCCPPLEEL